MIKLFEEYESEEYYSSITMEKFDEYLGVGYINALNFTIVEIRRIIDYCNEKGGLYCNYGSGTIRIHMVLHGTISKFSINIYKLEDEWFVVRVFGHSYYRCDQMEGLIKLLGNKLKL